MTAAEEVVRVGLDARGLVHRQYVIPVQVSEGRVLLLTNAPVCWCGQRMVGYDGVLPTSNPWPDINWLCDDHGNDGLAFEYVMNDNFVTVNAVAV